VRVGAGVGVQRGVRSQLVVRSVGARLRHSVAHTQPTRQRQQRRQLHPLLRRRTEVPPRLPADVLSVLSAGHERVDTATHRLRGGPRW